MNSLRGLDGGHKNGLEDIPDLAKVNGIESSGWHLKREVSDSRKSIAGIRRRVVLAPRTFSPPATIPLWMAMSLSSTTPAGVTVTILRRPFREVTFTKSALRGAIRLVAQHQTVSESLIARALGAGEPLGKGADISSSVVLSSISGTKFAVFELVTGQVPVSNRHVMKLGTY